MLIKQDDQNRKRKNPVSEIFFVGSKQLENRKLGFFVKMDWYVPNPTKTVSVQFL